jgi:2-oxoisovalerate dehydrogenase E1 component
MPSHWGKKELNIVSVSSPTGTQFLQAVGAAEGVQRANALGITEGFASDEVVLVTTGDGTTSEGEFWESLNTACNLGLPIVYLVEDNGYAISVPVEVGTAGGSISELVTASPVCTSSAWTDATCMASYEALDRAIRYARERKGPALVHAKVIVRTRIRSRTTSAVSSRGGARSRRGPRPDRALPEWLIANGHATSHRTRGHA